MARRILGEVFLIRKNSAEFQSDHFRSGKSPPEIRQPISVSEMDGLFSGKVLPVQKNSN